MRYIANRPTWDNLLIIYKDVLKSIGVDLNPDPHEWKTLLKYYNDFDYDAVTINWRMGIDTDFMQLWHSKFANEANSSNLSGFENTRVDELSEQLRLTFDTFERREIARGVKKSFMKNSRTPSYIPVTPSSSGTMTGHAKLMASNTDLIITIPFMVLTICAGALASSAQ